MEFNTENLQSQVDFLFTVLGEQPSVTTDSRSVRQGDIFFALRGENFNGNIYAMDALNQGAAYAVVDDESYALDERCLLVKDSLLVLQKLANRHRRSMPDLKVLAITGTNGKTTTKELCHAVLSKKYNVIATTGNLNNHIGVPLTLLRITKMTEIAIVEMGANHIGEIAALCKIAEPTHGLITNIGKAHLEGFGTLEGVYRAKTELFSYLNKNMKTCIINLNDDMLKDYNKTTAYKRVDYYTPPSAHHDHAQVDIYGITVKSRLIGSYNEQNIMAAMTVGKIFKVGKEAAAHAIENYEPSNHRSQIKKTDNNTLILDCYNANPSSVEVALKDFIAGNGINKVVCLGAMRELGKKSSKEHKKVIELLKTGSFYKIILVGEEFKEFDDKTIKNLLWFADSRGAKEYILENPLRHSTVLIKGSRSTKMEILEDAL